MQTSDCLRTARIWLSLNLASFMLNFRQVRKFYFSDPRLDGGITGASSSRRIAVVVGIAVLPGSRSQAGTRGFNAMFGRSARALLARHVGRSCLHPACYLGITLIDWMRLLCRASR